MKNALQEDFQLDIAFSGVPKALLDHDWLLAEELRKGRYVLGFSGTFETENQTQGPVMLHELDALEITTPGSGRADRHIPAFRNLIPPLPILLQAAEGSGFMNILTDGDGVLRRIPLILARQEKIYPQLALATLLKTLDPQAPNPVIKVSKQGIESLIINDIAIPLETNGAMLINYRGPRYTFPYLSAGDILNHKVDPDKLKGKIIFLGTSASGLRDIRVSPLDQVFPGVEVHATIVDNILGNDFIHRPDWVPGLELLLILLWGLITTILIGRANAVLTIPVTISLAGSAWYGGVLSLNYLNIWISPLFPLIVLALNFSALNMQKFWLAEQKKKFFKSAFSKYVSKSVVNQLVENPGKLSLEGEEKEISVLFSDIRNFTRISEQLPPSQITLLLNDYFTCITKIIINNSGTHDKFIGDAIMSFWNAPVDVNHHEKHAVKAALEMMDALADLNKGFEKKFNIRITAGIGLHSGRCRVGNMGSDDIFDYTIIGDNVNLASRLESLTKFYGVPIIISHRMLAGLSPGILVRELDRVRVKGKEKPVRIYTIYPNLDPAARARHEKEIEQYREGLSLYRNKKFKAGEARFKTLAMTYPGQKLYGIYRERCAALVNNPPGEEWDGVFTHTTK